MALNGAETVSAMGADSPLAVLSRKHQPLFNYFKQMFAQADTVSAPFKAMGRIIVLYSS